MDYEMTDARTAKQIAADSALTEAIEECIAAYSEGNDYEVLTDFVVTCAVQKINPKNGKLLTAQHILVRDGDVPWYRVVGLLELAKTMVTAQSFVDNDNEHDG